MNKRSKHHQSKGEGGFVFSTNPDFKAPEADDSDGVSGQQQLEAHLEKKGRGGKQVVIIKGFLGNALELAQLGKDLKVQCGVGGSVKDGEIVLQGNVRDKAIEILMDKGHRVKRVGA